AARARSVMRAGVSSPGNAAPRLGREPQAIAVFEDAERAVEIRPRARHRWEPGAARPVVLEPTGCQDHDDDLVRRDFLLPGELHHRGEPHDGRGLGVDAFFT